MNRIILSVFAVSLCFAVGQALQCYSCEGIWNLCVTSLINCNTGQQCYSGVGKAASFVDITTKGCLSPADCNQTSTVNFPAGTNTTVYKVTKTCCNTNLCNAAPGQLRMSVVHLALTTLIMTAVTKVLV
ncbi:hypothetical protein UPYG_G00340780 [Umbra pygmaea]|uniref:UPAR/Ly6 domain-containing protein n=1 Tax=Umbra pygmaea TaxID=75934 RepID=A0ABD0WFJ7_UMBPY